ncbi:hypothetical protein ACFE04_031885 [Oxalis oulophora]
MSLFTLTKRLLALKPKWRLFLNYQNRTLSTHSLTFHRTLNTHSKNPSHFTTIHSSSTQQFKSFDPLTQLHDSPDPTLLSLLKGITFFDSKKAMDVLDESGMKPTRDSVSSVIWALKDEWKVAFLAFKWGEKWGCFDTDEKVWNLIIWVLGCHCKFNIAWCLIKNLYLLKMDIKQAMIIMIDRYAAANNPSNAIWTFDNIEKFRLIPDEESYHALLNSLCKYGNIEEAEEFMLINKKLFPLNADGFNIILNGWCNISVDIYESKRIWREMLKNCVVPNATSYTYMISCYSKVGNLFESTRLYDEMTKKSWAPGVEVYNSLVYVMTRENCLKEALKMLEKMKENELQPDCSTYNSIIRPLCEAQNLEEARNLFSAMIKENLRPNGETYHAFLEVTDFSGILGILNRMKLSGLGPNNDTFLLIFQKFFKLKQPENVVKIWFKMEQYEILPSLAQYTLVIEGLAKCGYLFKAKEIYAKMIQDGYLDDPKLKKILKEPLKGSEDIKDKQDNLKKGGYAKSRDSRKPRKKKTSTDVSKS